MNERFEESESEIPRRSDEATWKTTLFGAQYKTSDREFEPPELQNDRYQLLEELDRGGMGIVYRANDQMLSRDAVVKILRNEYQESDPIRSAFENEAQIMGSLTHPGIPEIYERGICSDGRPYHVMKYVRGKTLSDILLGLDATESDLLSIFAKICQTMAFVHAQGVIHLDLKPDNIMVGTYGEVHVMDWGLARRYSAISGKSEWGFDSPLNGQINGTPKYMSPEQARGRNSDMRADVFGLGALLCEILIGHAPYEGDDLRQIYSRALTGSMDSTLSGLEDSETDRVLVRLAKRCLQPRRRDRPNSAVVVSREVAAYQESALLRVESDMIRFFELSLDMFCICGLDGYFRRINPNFSRVLGYPEKTLLSKPFMDFVHEDDRQATSDRMGELEKGKPVVLFRNRFRTIHDTYVTLEWTAKSVEQEGVIYAVARDVTQ